MSLRSCTIAERALLLPVDPSWPPAMRPGQHSLACMFCRHLACVLLLLHTGLQTLLDGTRRDDDAPDVSLHVLSSPNCSLCARDTMIGALPQQNSPAAFRTYGEIPGSRAR